MQWGCCVDGWPCAGLVMLRPLASGSGGRVDTSFPWNVPEPALDLAALPDLFEAAGGVYPTNQNLGHVSFRSYDSQGGGLLEISKIFSFVETGK